MSNELRPITVAVEKDNRRGIADLERASAGGEPVFFRGGSE
jgi:hypothetical protein